MMWMTIMAKGLKSNIKWEKKLQNSTYNLILDFIPPSSPPLYHILLLV